MNALRPVDRPKGIEFNHGDIRYWLINVEPCWQCGYAGRAEMHVLPLRGTSKLLYIKCSTSDCYNRTPEFSTADRAILHWNLTSALAK